MYSEELAKTICGRLAAGEPLTRICREEGMPEYGTVMDWLFSKKSGFVEMYEKAREQQAHFMAESIVDISDDGQNDYMERIGPDGQSLGYFINGEHVQRSRLRVDARKWVAAKLLPRRYGERNTTEITGPNDGPIKSEVTVKLDPSEAYLQMLNGGPIPGKTTD